LRQPVENIAGNGCAAERNNLYIFLDITRSATVLVNVCKRAVVPQFNILIENVRYAYVEFTIPRPGPAVQQPLCGGGGCEADRQQPRPG